MPMSWYNIRLVLAVVSCWRSIIVNIIGTGRPTSGKKCITAIIIIIILLHYLGKENNRRLTGSNIIVYISETGGRVWQHTTTVYTHAAHVRCRTVVCDIMMLMRSRCIWYTRLYRTTYCMQCAHAVVHCRRPVYIRPTRVYNTLYSPLAKPLTH